jgi:hypothetical protein
MALTRAKKFIASVFATVLLATGALAPTASAQQAGLVNVDIGNVSILRNVDVAVAANVIAGVCAIVDANVALLAVQGVDETGTTFTCTHRGNGRAVAVTDA